MGKQRLAVDENHPVVAHRGHARRRRRLHGDPPRLLALVPGEIARLDQHAVQIGRGSGFWMRALKPRVSQCNFIAGDDIGIVPTQANDRRARS